jgi:hypothetical protein
MDVIGPSHHCVGNVAAVKLTTDSEALSGPDSLGLGRVEALRELGVTHGN